MTCQSCLTEQHAYICGGCRQRENRRRFTDGKSFARWRLEQEANLRARRVFYRVAFA